MNRLAMLALALVSLGSAVIEARPARIRPEVGALATTVHVRKGLSFAKERCAACHGVTRNSSSPNPESPTFEDIANRPGLTAQTLREFLRDSHNFPESMQFRVERERIRDLADYIVTLRHPRYKPDL
ncbi:c-type cytochrome [Novosphingobium sp. B 225]|uniref:c-type cytochrome n=1 Tax=Novosphingobium sp. B 225 TaxID=1961849 RepID=UPI001124F061|nr:c-type cytochrome [Novosphingobium sp. B 225]